MPSRIPVPAPDAVEESRQVAESVADMHYVVSSIVEGATELVPGETVDELRAAWRESEPSFRELVGALLATSTPPISHKTLAAAQLTGDVGRLKLSTLRRLKDLFFQFWNSAPQTDERLARAADAGRDYLELSGTIVSSIPGWEKIEELLSLIKQLIGVRRKRDA